MTAQSALHNPRNASTPSQLLFAAKRQKAVGRMERAAELYSVFADKDIPPERRVPESPKEWLTRQIQNAMPPVDEAKIAAVKSGVDPTIPVAKRPMVHDVQMAVCQHFKITVGDLVLKCRERRLAQPRHYALYLAYHLCGRTMPDLGRRFGNRDHTTILHSVHKIRDLRPTDPAVEATVLALTATITAERA